MPRTKAVEAVQMSSDELNPHIKESQMRQVFWLAIFVDCLCLWRDAESIFKSLKTVREAQSSLYFVGPAS
jgi:hypothetical protein